MSTRSYYGPFFLDSL